MEAEKGKRIARSGGIDRSLIDKAKAGDRVSQEILLSHYEGRVFDLIMRIVRNREDALDALQDTMIKALLNLDRYDPERDFGKWLMRIATTTCLDLLRKRKREANLRDGQDVLSLASCDQPIDRSAAARLSCEAVERALGRLQPKYRTVILLRYRDEFSYAEIAETLAIPLGTVKVLLHRAHHMLRRLVGKEVNNEIE